MIRNIYNTKFHNVYETDPSLEGGKSTLGTVSELVLNLPCAISNLLRKSTIYN